LKWLIYGLYGIFISLMVITFIMAGKFHDDLVETGYYEKSKTYFSDKEREEKAGVSISYPETLRNGERELPIEIKAGGKPVLDARGTILISSISTRRTLGSYEITSSGEGKYRSVIGKLQPGRYLVSLEVHSKESTWRRRWVMRVE